MSRKTLFLASLLALLTLILKLLQPKLNYLPPEFQDTAVASQLVGSLEEFLKMFPLQAETLNSIRLFRLFTIVDVGFIFTFTLFFLELPNYYTGKFSFFVLVFGLFVGLCDIFEDYYFMSILHDLKELVESGIDPIILQSDFNQMQFWTNAKWYGFVPLFVSIYRSIKPAMKSTGLNILRVYTSALVVVGAISYTARGVYQQVLAIIVALNFAFYTVHVWVFYYTNKNKEKNK
jgi:uncharacterized membrane protein YuzA (DUF378 family)